MAKKPNQINSKLETATQMASRALFISIVALAAIGFTYGHFVVAIPHQRPAAPMAQMTKMYTQNLLDQSQFSSQFAPSDFNNDHHPIQEAQSVSGLKNQNNQDQINYDNQVKALMHLLVDNNSQQQSSTNNKILDELSSSAQPIPSRAADLTADLENLELDLMAAASADTTSTSIIEDDFRVAAPSIPTANRQDFQNQSLQALEQQTKSSPISITTTTSSPPLITTSVSPTTTTTAITTTTTNQSIPLEAIATVNSIQTTTLSPSSGVISTLSPSQMSSVPIQTTTTETATARTTNDVSLVTNTTSILPVELIDQNSEKKIETTPATTAQTVPVTTTIDIQMSRDKGDTVPTTTTTTTPTITSTVRLDLQDKVVDNQRLMKSITIDNDNFEINVPCSSSSSSYSGLDNPCRYIVATVPVLVSTSNITKNSEQNQTELPQTVNEFVFMAADEAVKFEEDENSDRRLSNNASMTVSDKDLKSEHRSLSSADNDDDDIIEDFEGETNPFQTTTRKSTSSNNDSSTDDLDYMVNSSDEELQPSDSHLNNTRGEMFDQPAHASSRIGDIIGEDDDDNSNSEVNTNQQSLNRSSGGADGDGASLRSTIPTTNNSTGHHHQYKSGFTSTTPATILSATTLNSIFSRNSPSQASSVSNYQPTASHSSYIRETNNSGTFWRDQNLLTTLSNFLRNNNIYNQKPSLKVERSSGNDTRPMQIISTSMKMSTTSSNNQTIVSSSSKLPQMVETSSVTSLPSLSSNRINLDRQQRIEKNLNRLTDADDNNKLINNNISIPMSLSKQQATSMATTTTTTTSIPTIAASTSTTSSSRSARNNRNHHNRFFHEPMRRISAGSDVVSQSLTASRTRNSDLDQQRQVTSTTHTYSPIENGADMEEAEILTRINVPSQLTRLQTTNNSRQKQLSVVNKSDEQHWQKIGSGQNLNTRGASHTTAFHQPSSIISSSVMPSRLTTANRAIKSTWSSYLGQNEEDLLINDDDRPRATRPTSEGIRSTQTASNNLPVTLSQIDQKLKSSVKNDKNINSNNITSRMTADRLPSSSQKGQQQINSVNNQHLPTIKQTDKHIDTADSDHSVIFAIESSLKTTTIKPNVSIMTTSTTTTTTTSKPASTTMPTSNTEVPSTTKSPTTTTSTTSKTIQEVTSTTSPPATIKEFSRISSPIHATSTHISPSNLAPQPQLRNIYNSANGKQRLVPQEHQIELQNHLLDKSVGIPIGFPSEVFESPTVKFSSKQDKAPDTKALTAGWAALLSEFEGSAEDQLASDDYHYDRNRASSASLPMVSSSNKKPRLEIEGNLRRKSSPSIGSKKVLNDGGNTDDGQYHTSSVLANGVIENNKIDNNPPGRPGIDYPIYGDVPKTSFDCRNHDYSGFYADIESDCQAYHSCHKGRGGRHTFLCPNGTLFSQELLTCDWWYNVQCSESKLFFPAPSTLTTTTTTTMTHSTSNRQGNNNDVSMLDILSGHSVNGLATLIGGAIDNSLGKQQRQDEHSSVSNSNNNNNNNSSSSFRLKREHDSQPATHRQPFTPSSLSHSESMEMAGTSWQPRLSFLRRISSLVSSS